MSHRRGPIARASLFFVMAALLAVLSVEATSKLWAAYHDSPWWIYAGYGGGSGVFAVICSVAAVRSLRNR